MKSWMEHIRELYKEIWGFDRTNIQKYVSAKGEEVF